MLPSCKSESVNLGHELIETIDRILVVNPFMHNVVKWPNILKYVWPFYNIMHERVKT